MPDFKASELANAQMNLIILNKIIRQELLMFKQ